MPSIRQGALEYKAPETKNIADLQSVSTEIDYEVKEFTKEDGSTFKVNVFEHEGEEYRVPNSVLKQLKDQLAERPEATKFKAVRSGTGLNTSYTVVLLD